MAEAFLSNTSMIWIALAMGLGVLGVYGLFTR